MKADEEEGASYVARAHEEEVEALRKRCGMIEGSLWIAHV